METRCPLCRRFVPNESQRWCTCGSAMDARCYDAHAPWCASDGDERWIGAQEL
ncbi:hypothetical protein ACFQGT_06330 [Natrialbaceae archaeon GCM10025810]|uniref:hypothetical protein n=1 Tax=Halovalidus salilacus TaxID=3075124 RepID=UPI0036096BD6